MSWLSRRREARQRKREDVAMRVDGWMVWEVTGVRRRERYVVEDCGCGGWLKQVDMGSGRWMYEGSSWVRLCLVHGGRRDDVEGVVA